MAVSGAKLDKAVFLGIQMTFSKPQAIVWFLEGFLYYFLYRYYLYLVQEPDLLIKKTFYDQLHGFSWLKLKDIKDSLYPDAAEYGGDYDFRKMQKTGIFTREVKAVTGRSESGGQINGTFEINILRFFWQGFRAICYTVFNRSYVTDYFLPFVIFSVAAICGFILHVSV